MYTPNNPLMPFDPTALMTKATAKVRDVVCAKYDAKLVRFASRFTFVDTRIDMSNCIPRGQNIINLTKWLAILGLNYDGQVNIKVFFEKVFTYFGIDMNVDQLNKVLPAYGYTLDTVQPLPVKYLLLDVLGIAPAVICTAARTTNAAIATDTVKPKRNRRRRSRGKAKIKAMPANTTTATTKIDLPVMNWKINLIQARRQINAWYLGNVKGTKRARDTKILGMTLYVYSPAIHDVKTLFGHTAIAFKIVLVGNQLVIVDHKITTVDEYVMDNGLAIKPWSRMAVYDIETDTHKVPFTGLLLKLIRNGYINIAEFGIKDVAAFVTDTFLYGLNKAFTDWMDALALINGTNTRIKDNATVIATAVRKGYTPQTVHEIAVASAKVFDGIDTDVPVADLVTIGAGVNDPFGLNLPTSFDTPKIC